MSAKAKNGIVSYIIRPFMWLFSGLKWLGIAIVVMIAIFMSYLMYIWGKMGYQMSGKTTDTEIVHIKLDGKVPLYIPKAYLTSPRAWKGGDQDVISMKALLPDMQPASLNPENIEEERVSITFYSAIEGGRSDMVGEIQRLKPYLEDTGFGIDKLLPTFYEDKKAGKISIAGYAAHSDHYLAVIEGDRYIWWRCEKKAPRCGAYTTFDDILGYYSVSRAYIPDNWKEIDGQIVGLIESFRQKPAQKKE